MATAKKSASRVERSFTASHKILVVFAALLVAAVVGLLVWQVREQRAAEVEKAQFAQAERDIDALTDQIIAASGQPLKVEKNKYCSRPNSKFDNGPLSCDVQSTLFYGVDSIQQANSLHNSQLTSIGSLWRLGPASDGGKDTTQFTSLSATNAIGNKTYQQLISTRLGTSAAIPCTAIFMFFVASNPPYIEYEVPTGAPYVVTATLDCGGRARIQHFPMNS